jgi:hypothetical protein
MLYRINGRGQDVLVTKMIFPKDYQRVRAAMTPVEVAAVVDEINRLTDEAGAEIITTSWLPGADWSGTPFDAIYVACGQHHDAAAKAFGLFCWDTIQRRPERWSFGHYELNGVPIRGMTYFRIN